MRRHYAMLQRNLFNTGLTSGALVRLQTRRLLVLIVQRHDDVPTGTRKECHSRRTNSACATKAEGRKR
jgi:hypothetical protein